MLGLFVMCSLLFVAFELMSLFIVVVIMYVSLLVLVTVAHYYYISGHFTFISFRMFILFILLLLFSLSLCFKIFFCFTFNFMYFLYKLMDFDHQPPKQKRCVCAVHVFVYSMCISALFFFSRFSGRMYIVHCDVQCLEKYANKHVIILI